MSSKADALAREAASADHTLLVQQLFVKHQSAIRAFILSLRPNFAEAEDILQEVFLTVARKAEEFRLNSSFIAWSFAIARYKVLEAHRREERKASLDLSEETIECLAASMPEEDFFESKVQTVHRCLDQLAPRAQEVIRLRYHGEHGPEEIARRLDWTRNAVNVALSKARAALRDCVARQWREN